MGMLKPEKYSNVKFKIFSEMAEKNIAKLNIKSAHDLIQSGKLSSRELLSQCLENIKKNKLNSFVEVFDDAYEKAEEIDRKVAEGQTISLLAGIPVAVKDNILLKGKKCSAGSKILENYVAPYSAGVAEKLQKEGAVFVGRTNMDEFAMGSSTEHSCYGPTKNPYDKKRVPGGSSGGSAAAVAGGECLVALGSDTGGSIRQPASFCGVVGVKPTYGAVSRRGLISMASSLDQIGPIGKTVEDAEAVFNAIKGRDPLDSTSVEPEIVNCKLKIENFTVGVPREFFSIEGDNSGFSDGAVSNFKKALELLQEMGLEIKEISIPGLKYATEAYYIIMASEVSSNLARYDGIKYGFSKKEKTLLDGYMRTRKEGFGDEVRRRIMLGTYALSSGYYDAYYGRAQKAREAIKKDMKKAFDEADIILSPTTPTPAFKAGEKTKDPVEMYKADIFTVAANLTGLPAISVPYGQENGLPLGVQFMAPWFEEEKLFYMGKFLE